MEGVTSHGAATLRDYLRVVQERKWLVVLALVLVPLAALFLSLRQERLYRASSDVVLHRQDLAGMVSGFLQTYEDPTRIAATQVELAKVPQLAQRVVKAAGVNRSAAQLLNELTVSASPSSDVLTFSVKDRNPDTASRLATDYARGYAAYSSQLDAGAVRRALTQVEKRLAEIGIPTTKSPLFNSYESLLANREQLRTLQALQTTNSGVVRASEGAVQVQPRPKRNVAVAIVLGLLLGLGLAFLWNALDTRVRSVEHIRDVLGLPLLARIPGPSRRDRRRNEVAMLSQPASAQAEAFRMLRTNLEFVNLERRARSIMFTSAVEREGKSTTIVNLAIALARSGKRVTLVDLDLRRPSLDRTFELQGRAGLTDVALGHVTLDEAVSTVAIPQAGRRDGARSDNGSVATGIGGLLQVLTSGPSPPDPGEFVATGVVGDIFRRLEEHADIVLVDSPPLLHVGDAMALSAKVDALVVVTRLNVVRRPMLAELRRVLAACPAEKLGFVLTGADLEHAYAEAYYYYAPRGAGRGERERVA